MTTKNEIVRKELQRIYRKHGVCTPEMVVEASKSKRNPLHPYFYWDDDAKAAEIGRREIARMLILRIKIEPAKAEDLQMTINTRQYVGRLGGGYYDISDVVDDGSMLQAHIDNAHRDFLAFRRKYESIKGMTPLFDAVESGLEKARPPKSLAAKGVER